MLISTTRPLYFTGLLVLGSGLWTLQRLDLFQINVLDPAPQLQLEQQYQEISITHTLIQSLSTYDGGYFPIDMEGELAMNPNIIPHPFMDDTWILVAQLRQETQYFTELVCAASFQDGVLRCDNHPSKLPIAPTFGDKCTGDLDYISLNQGPHDARIFYGPRRPYTIFGSNSRYTCFGQWVQDFRNLVEWAYDTEDSSDEFSLAVELQRPPPWSMIEKNWFLFWDLDGHMYIHHDLAPHRVFASMDSSGIAGPNLASIAHTHDEVCMSSYMPVVGPELESIHQATNSLSLTMCRRDDTSCVPDISNTFIFTIFQHKKYHNFHAVYEPHVLVFEQAPPFRIHAISTKPFWIFGRRSQAAKALSNSEPFDPNYAYANVTYPTEQMMYVTSMSWRDRTQKYHGYMDDVLFIAFGIEDETTAAIDVAVGDLVSDLGFC